MDLLKLTWRSDALKRSPTNRNGPQISDADAYTRRHIPSSREQEADGPPSGRDQSDEEKYIVIIKIWATFRNAHFLTSDQAVMNSNNGSPKRIVDSDYLSVMQACRDKNRAIDYCVCYLSICILTSFHSLTLHFYPDLQLNQITLSQTVHW